MKTRRRRCTIVWKIHFRSNCGIFGGQPQPSPENTGSLSMSLKARRANRLPRLSSSGRKKLLIHVLKPVCIVAYNFAYREVEIGFPLMSKPHLTTCSDHKGG